MLLVSSGVSSSSSKIYIDDLFSTQLRTGTGSTASITTGFQPDLIWTKSRSAATGHRLVDSVRGAGNSLESNSLLQQQSEATGITAFSSSGYSIGTDSDYNTSGAGYVDWCWKKAPKFFDVVTYIGDGTNNRQIPHSLGVAPGKVIVKKVTTKTGSTADWITWHRGIGDGYLYLNTTNSVFSGANTLFGSPYSAPTSSVFSVGLNLNVSTETYVAYIFAHDTSADGVIRCGSFTTDASGNSTVNLGWEPQYLLVKPSSAVGNWVMSDASRGWLADPSYSPGLFANLSNNESASVRALTPTSTGMKAVANGLTASTTYIYLAIRRPNKPPTTGTQVFSANASSAATGTAITTGFPIDLQIANYRLGTNENSAFFDRLRGVSTTATESGPYVSSSRTNAEITGTTTTREFDNAGFKIASFWGGASTIYWNFKRAPGFMDVVCYTGDGVTNRAVPHSLGVAPDIMIVKCRTVAEDWNVYTSQTGLLVGYLNSNLGFANNNWASQTSTNIYPSFPSNPLIGNASGRTYVAYLFATLPGISKVGNYIGNGSSQTINCGFSTGARFILIKRTDSTGDWYIWDSARGIVSANDPHLSLNTTAAEVTTDDSVDPDNTGFIVNQVAATNINVNNATYLYLAIA